MKQICGVLNTFYGQVFGIAAVNLLILPFLPWWSFIIPAFAFARFYRRGVTSFVIAGLGSMLPWGIMILVRYRAGGELIISRVTEMMGLSSPWQLTLITLLIPLIPGGLAGVSGFTIFSRKTHYND